MKTIGDVCLKRSCVHSQPPIKQFFANGEVETVTAAHQGHFFEAHSVVPFILYCITV